MKAILLKTYLISFSALFLVVALICVGFSLGNSMQVNEGTARPDAVLHHSQRPIASFDVFATYDMLVCWQIAEALTWFKNDHEFFCLEK